MSNDDIKVVRDEIKLINDANTVIRQSIATEPSPDRRRELKQDWIDNCDRLGGLFDDLDRLIRGGAGHAKGT